MEKWITKRDEMPRGDRKKWTRTRVSSVSENSFSASGQLGQTQGPKVISNRSLTKKNPGKKRGWFMKEGGEGQEENPRRRKRGVKVTAEPSRHP